MSLFKKKKQPKKPTKVKSTKSKPIAKKPVEAKSSKPVETKKPTTAKPTKIKQPVKVDNGKQDRYFAKEVNGKGYLFDRKFANARVPIATETTYEFAVSQAEKFNKEARGGRPKAKQTAKPVKPQGQHRKQGKK